MTSHPEERWELDTQRPVRHLLRRNRLPVIGIGLLGSGIGLIEAFLLVLVVRIASVVAGEVVDVGAVDFGLIELDRISTSQGFLIGGIGVVVLLLFQVTAAATEAQVARREVVEARDRTVSSFLAADWRTQSSVPDGEFITTVTAYADRVQSSLSFAMLAVAAGSSFTAMLAVAIVVDPPAAAAIALAGGGFGVLMRPLTRFSRRYSERMSSATKKHTAEISRMLRVRRDIAAFDVARPMAARLLYLSGEQARWTAWTRFTVRMVPNLYRTIVIVVLFLGLGGVRALGVTNIPSIAAIVLILLRALNYTQTVQSMVQSLAETTPPLRMLAEEIERFDEAEVVRRGEPLDRIDTIQLVDVGFQYDDGDPVLADLDLTLRRGEVVGVIGPSGAGKSTLVDVLMGLRVPTAGEVLVNDAPLSTLDVLSLRTLTALVPQEPQMLRGSIRDNVVFLRDGLTDDAVLEALDRAQLGVLVGERGLDSEVGEHGGSLSGGQRQRLGIARALAGSPDVVILDEPTSALDVDAERQVVGVLEQLRGDRITIVISHRPAALEVCDQVLVLTNQATYRVVDRRSIADIDTFLSAAVRAPDDGSGGAEGPAAVDDDAGAVDRRDEGAA